MTHRYIPSSWPKIQGVANHAVDNLVVTHTLFVRATLDDLFLPLSQGPILPPTPDTIKAACLGGTSFRTRDFLTPNSSENDYFHFAIFIGAYSVHGILRPVANSFILRFSCGDK